MSEPLDSLQSVSINYNDYRALLAERDRLKAQRDSLLAALEGLLESTTTDSRGEFINISEANHSDKVATARAAIEGAKRP